jgi:site-specific DNA recombinase
LKRTVMEMKLLIHGTTGPARREPDRSLLRLIGHARCFNDMVMNGRGKTITDLAAEAGASPSYFTRVYRLSFLSPDITKTIVQGRQPPELAANKLMLTGKLASAWSTQRCQLGLD